MKTQVIQKAIVKNKNGEILLLRRSQTDVRRPGQWDLPGGLLDKGEHLEDCINREIKEETGLTAKSLRPIFTKTEIRSWKDHDGQHTDNVVFIFYLGQTDKQEPTLSYEHDKCLWIKPEDALKEIQYYLHKEVLEHLLKNKLI